MQRQRLFQPMLVACCLAATSLAGRAAAQTTATSAALPSANSGNTHSMTGHGLKLDLDTRWIEGPGYRPVRITVRPLAPLTAERSLTAILEVQQYPTRLEVPIQIDLPVGSSAVTSTTPVPEFTEGCTYTLRVYEDGRALKPLEVPWTSMYRPNSVGQSEVLPRILLVEAEWLATAIPKAFPDQLIAQTTAYSPTPQGANPLSLPTAVSWRVADLPEDWLPYTSVDVVCMPGQTLAHLQANEPKKFETLLAWTASGGNLWISQPGGFPGDELRQFDRAIGYPAQSAGQGWREPDPVLFGKRLAEVAPAQFGTYDNRTTSNTAGQGESKKVEISRTPPRSAGMILRPYEQGMIAVLDELAFEDNPERMLEWLLAEVRPARWLWSQRHGISLAGENSDFWNFLIPGVGLAPVVEFCVMITVFVLAIGPINYWFLRRRKKLHLMILTVPGCAAAVTVALFTYALISDGLSTRLRMRSVTALDQRRGHATCWARLSYYAGLAPAGGLTFSRDTAVYCYDETPGGGRGSGRGRREFVWGDNQRLVSGWLPSRTPTQLVTVRSRPSQITLDLEKDQEGKLRVVNRLGVRILDLAVHTYDDHWYRAETIEPDARAGLEPADANVALARLATQANAARPQMPPYVRRPTAGGALGISPRSYRYYAYRYSASAPVSQSTSRLEQSLAVLTNPAEDKDGLLGLGSYVAIVERSPEAETGTPAARAESGFHVILGKW